MNKAKSIAIQLQMVQEAYKKVKTLHGISGINRETIRAFEKDRQNNLYKIWNRMSAGSYTPAVMPVASTGKRQPAMDRRVEDQIAQMVIVMIMESSVLPSFPANSFTDQLDRSAHPAITQARERCGALDWVVDLQLKAFLESVPHELLFAVLEKYGFSKWVMDYISRWITAPYQAADGTIAKRAQGLPTGAVISPILANLVLYTIFDNWMQHYHPFIPFERYGQAILCHCVSQHQATYCIQAIAQQLQQNKLQLDQDATHIVYCGDNLVHASQHHIQFDFLGFTFKPRRIKDQQGAIVHHFAPAIGLAARKKIRETVRKWDQHYWVQLTPGDIACQINPVIQEWINYYGAFGPDTLKKVLYAVNQKLARWIRNKYKGFRHHKIRAIQRLGDMALANPDLFTHWKWGVRPRPRSGSLHRIID